MDQQFGGAPVQVRVIMGKEPHHFMAIFKGKLVIYEVRACRENSTLRRVAQGCGIRKGKSCQTGGVGSGGGQRSSLASSSCLASAHCRRQSELCRGQVPSPLPSGTAPAHSPPSCA